jgi:hypothetical protein
MAKQTINIGTRANDASGDTIRDAFDKVNDNFNEIYTELGNPGTDLKFSNATISTDNTNQDLTLDPNGTGSVVVTGDLSVSGTITGTISVSDVATFVGDDSTGTSITSGETFKFAGTQNVTTAVSGDTLTITGPDLSSYATQAYVTSQLSSSDHNITFVGDDSTGTADTQGETFKFAGGNNITTAVSGDTLTITGSKSINVVEITSDDSTAVTVRDNLIVTGSIGGQSALQITSDINVAQNLTFTSGGSVDRILDEDTMSSDSDTALATQQSIKAYVDAQNQSQALTFVGDDSTGTAVNSGETFKIAGTQNVTTAVSGDTLTITGPDLSSYLTSETSHADVLVDGDFASAGFMKTDGSGNYSIDANTYLTSVAFGDLTSTPTTLSGYGITDAVTSGSTAVTMVGDDSTGTGVNIGETFKIAGTQNVSTAVSGDTLTITGPDLSNYLQNTGTQTIDNLSFNDNIISTSSNADLNLNPGGTGNIVASAPLHIEKGYVENINALTSSSTISVDCSIASVHTVTLAENTGFVINNLPTGGTVTIIITQDGGGTNTATFGTDGSTAVKFAGGTPTLSTAGNAIDVVTIFNDGTNYLGNIAKAYAA